MRARDMHPLCCITVDCPGFNFGGGRSDQEEDDAAMDTTSRVLELPDGAHTSAVAGILYKWTNFSKGWRPRWFVLKDGLLTYCKMRRPELTSSSSMDSNTGSSRLLGGSGTGTGQKTVRIVHLKISSFRESKSDEKRFYIITPTETLQLRTNSVKDRVAWIEALVSARRESRLVSDSDITFSTQRLRSRMRAEGLGEAFIKDCEKIVQSEFSEYFVHMRVRYEDYFSFLGTFPRHLEELESSDEIDQKQEEEEEDEPCFFDTRQSFSETSNINKIIINNNNNNNNNNKRRTRLPEPIEKEKGVSLWSMIKDNVGKDLTRVCLPVYFNEPLSSLQKCFEDLEYSYLLDRAYEFGNKGNSLMRILNVAAFAVSGYASSEGRHCKPFNPLLGETFEADYPEKGLRFFSEKVSHHPMVMACHCEGKGWKFWGHSNLKSKFWGQSIQLDPVGILTLEFDDGEIFQWSKVTTTIYNLIIGKVFLNHHGTMNIISNRRYSCTLNFKVHSFLDRNPRQVEGFVKEESSGRKVASLLGKWDDCMRCTVTDDSVSSVPPVQQNSTLLWKKNSPSLNPTRYNLSSFAITLNELTSELKEKLPPTDSRLRPDQRYLENGEYEKANAEKLRLEKRQRMSNKLQESGWEPIWFRRSDEEGMFNYLGGYWEARELRNWDGCPDIFGELDDSKL